MIFTDATLVLPEDRPSEAAVALLRQLVRPGGRGRVLAVVKPGGDEPERHWTALSRRVARAEALLSATAAALDALTLELDVVYEVSAAALTGEVLVLTEPRPERLVSSALKAGLSVAWPGSTPIDALTEVALPWWREPRGALSAAALLRTRLPPNVHTTFLAIDPQGMPPDAESVRQILGWPTPLMVEVIDAGFGLLRAALNAYTDDHPVDLVTLSAPTGPALTPFLWLARGSAPDAAFLLVPGGHSPAELKSRLEVPDMLLLGGRLRGSVLWVDTTGRATPAEDEVLSLLHGGEPIATIQVTSGQFDCPAPPDMPALVGIAQQARADLEGMYGAARVIRPGDARVALFDATLDPAPWSAHMSGERRWWAVLLDPLAGAGDARGRLTSAHALIDASAVLQDGHPDDLPDGVEPIRLERVARHLRASGVSVDLVVGADAGPGYASLTATTLASLTPDALEDRIRRSWHPPRPEDPLLEITGASLTAADTLHIELDNGAARRRLLALIADAAESVHLQTYIFEDDAVGNLVADALCAAADRGVVVRVLVDSLYSLHGSLGWTNPPLARLEANPGVTLHAVRPVAALADLKRRNHRKLMIVDERVGKVSGRNIGAMYFTGFDEVALSEQTAYRDVPWLDAGAEVTGPVVADLSECFRLSWRSAGGADFPAPRPGGQGAIPLRFVTHDSMADAQTLDTYRWLLESASSRVTVVNTFPLQFELQRVLLSLMARGVEVRFLVGNVRPSFNNRQPFPGGQFRELATQVIHGRLDALVEAGAEVFEYGLAPRPGWSPGLTRVLPHVHAKLVSVDGRMFAVGSANLDITAGYWESEALLVVEDPGQTAALEARLEALMAHSPRVDPDDPDWKARAGRRAWLSRHWPSALG